MPKKSVELISPKSKKRSDFKKESNDFTKSKNMEVPRTNLEDKLLENLVVLQRINTNMAEKFDKLSKQISHLLLLFETTAKSFAEQPGIKKDEELIRRLDTLIDQNKTIAKGISLLHDKIERPSNIPQPPSNISQASRPIARQIPSPAPQMAPKQQPQGQVQESNSEENKQVQEISGTPAPQGEEFKPDASGRPLPKF